MESIYQWEGARNEQRKATQECVCFAKMVWDVEGMERSMRDSECEHGIWSIQSIRMYERWGNDHEASPWRTPTATLPPTSHSPSTPRFLLLMYPHFAFNAFALS